MAVFVVRSRAGKIVSRHLRATCPRLLETADREGWAPLDFRVSNTKANGYGDESTRCSLCFFDLGPLALSPREFPPWVVRADRYVPEAGTGFVYDIYWPAGRLSHVGITRNLGRRFREYWRETCRGGFSAEGIFWLNERLHADPTFEPKWEVEVHPEAGLRAAERARRARRRGEGWEVATDA
jgi:hypothetical protein